MVITSILLLAPFSLIAAIIYSYMILNEYKLYQNINNIIIRKILIIVTYFTAIIILTISLSLLGMMLFMGILGFILILFLDIYGIVLLVKKRDKSIKQVNSFDK